MNGLLPPGWIEARLSDLAEIQLGKMLDKQRSRGTRLPYLRNANVQWGRIDTTDLFEMPFHGAEMERYALHPGDVLVCEGGEPGRAAVWRTANSSIKFQKALHRVRFPRGIEADWLVHLLYLHAHGGRLAQHFTGTTIGHLTREAFVEYVVPVAPAAEQRRIVAALESYLSRLDEAEAALERVGRHLKRYRAAVLQAAVEGRLVPTETELARAEGRDYEPASELLKRILAERRRCWEESELLRLRVIAKTPQDDKWKTKYQDPIGPVESSRLPEGWTAITVDALGWDAGYGTSQKCRGDASGPPVLRIPNVQNETVKLQQLKYATLAEDLTPKDALEPGDFLFIRTNGSQGLIGRGALVPPAFPANHYFASYLIRLRLVPVDVVPQWTALVWQSDLVRRQVLAQAASSAGQFNLTLSAAKRFIIPLPPLAEQRRILDEVARSSSVTENSALNVQRSLERSAQLRQSVLKWAFEGKLVDQDPNDEPASALLERIRAERAAKSSEPSQRRSRKRQAQGPERGPTEL
jgi:type I restriction enzyme S subunit